jgi:cytochrome c oxidase cbb3-type subunit 3
MLNSFWNWFVILISVLTILACWWLLHWTKGVSDRSGDEIGSTGHVWDDDLNELNTPLPRWWLHLFNITIVFALVYLVFFPGLGNFAGVLGWTQETQYQDEMAAAQAAQESVFARFRDMDPAALMADADAMATAGRLFRQNCAMCHGSDGRALPVSQPRERRLAVGRLARTGHGDARERPHGRHAVLGGAAGRRRRQRGSSLRAAAVRPGSRRPARQRRPGALSDVLHRLPWPGRHRQPGAWRAQPDGRNLASRGDSEDIEYAVRNGRNGMMPAFGQTLPEERRKLLAAYVQSLSGN